MFKIETKDQFWISRLNWKPGENQINQEDIYQSKGMEKLNDKLVLRPFHVAKLNLQPAFMVKQLL